MVEKPPTVDLSSIGRDVEMLKPDKFANIMSKGEKNFKMHLSFKERQHQKELEKEAKKKFAEKKKKE